MIFVKENLVFLHKQYRELRKKETVIELHHVVNLEFNYLIAMDEEIVSRIVSSTSTFWTV
jgi:hypothetical protein